MNRKEATRVIIAAAMTYRELLRKFNMYETADRVRDALLVIGVKVEDKTKNETV